jgi:hypothetical protein
MKKISRKDDEFKQLFLDENEKRSLEIRSGSFDPRHITQCRRRIMYRAMSKEKSFDNLYFENSHQRAIANKWIGYLKACHKTHLFEPHAIVADAELNLKGVVDALVKYEDVFHAINVRPVNNETFQQIQEKGCLRKDAVDLIVCMWMAEVPFGILIYENNDNQEIETFEISKNDLVIQQVKSKCKELIPYQLKGNLPNRDYKDSDSKECKACEYRDICFNKKG